jgi:hypothetical protein
MSSETTKEAAKYPAGIYVSADILTDETLTLGERIVLAYIDGFSRAGKPCFASSETMAELLGMNASFIRNARNELVRKGRAVRTEVDGHPIFFSIAKTVVLPKPTGGVGNPNGGVGKDNRGCCQEQQGVLVKTTQYNNNNISITDLRESENAPPQDTDADPVDKRLFEAERYLATPTGKEPWERDNQYINGGRRPMKKYPALWFTAMELADAIEEVKAALSEDDDIRPVFKIAQSEALSQSIAHGNRKVTAYKYVTGFALTQYQESLRKATQLQNSRRKS